MKILFIANCTNSYGANQSMLNLSDELTRQGNEVFFFFPQHGPFLQEIRKKSYPYHVFMYQKAVHRMGDKKIQSLKSFWENVSLITDMQRCIEKWQIDIIHTNSATHDIGAMLAMKMKLPHVWHIREMLDDDYFYMYNCKQVQCFWMRKADKIIYISKAVKQHHTDMITNCVVIHDPIECQKYVIDRECYFKTPQLRLLLCGAIARGKGQMDALKAVNILVKKYKLDLELKIVGDGEQAYYARLKSYVASRHLEPYVQFLPFCNDLKQIREDSDIALMCSRNEALGRVTIESMLSELCIVGTNSGATTELIGEEKRGYLYGVGNYKELAKKIYDAREHMEDTIVKIKCAKRYALREFDLENRTNDVIKVYESVLKSKKE